MKVREKSEEAVMRKGLRWLGIGGGIALVLGALVVALTGSALYGLAAGSSCWSPSRSRFFSSRTG